MDWGVLYHFTSWIGGLSDSIKDIDIGFLAFFWFSLFELQIPEHFASGEVVKNLCLLMIGLFLSLNFVRPPRSGSWISWSLCTEVCKSVLMTAASVRYSRLSGWGGMGSVTWELWGGLQQSILHLALIFVLYLQIPSCCNPWTGHPFLFVYWCPNTIWRNIRNFTNKQGSGCRKNVLEQDHWRNWVPRKNRET